MQLTDFINHPNTSEASHEFRTAQPFPHIVLDDFLKGDILDEVIEGARSAEPFIQMNYYKYENSFEKKFAMDKLEKLPKAIGALLLFFNASPFVSWLERLTGIKGLIPDPHFRGGGHHAIPHGGLLGVHEDYGIHPDLKIYRRLNLLVYLNRNWSPKFGGALELWRPEMDFCQRQVYPNVNRAVVFETPGANHGHPDPQQSLRWRHSIALYYFTAEPPPYVNRESTKFKLRPQDPKTPEILELLAKRNKGRLATNV